MTRTAVEALAVAAMVGVSALSLSAPGLGVGAAVGAALTAPAYAGPPPYGPVDGAYSSPAWTQIRIPDISLTMMDSLISANRA